MKWAFDSQSMRLIPLLGIIALLLGSFAGCSTSYTQLALPPPEAEPEPPPYGGAFHEISGYGTWIEVHPFGLAWQPSVVAGWRPYSHGHWAWTSYGWTWVSYEPFGWAVYHYGHWYYDPAWGWIWLPGDEWYPSRVDWYIYDDYVCWSPLPPPGYYYGDPWSAHVTMIWNVVYVRDFVKSDVGRFTMKKIRPTEPKGGLKIRRKAPDVAHVERYTRTKIQPVDIGVKKVKVGQREYRKMKLPPSEKKTVDRYKPGVERHVITPQTDKKTRTTTKPVTKPKKQPEKTQTRPKSEKKKKKAD